MQRREFLGLGALGLGGLLLAPWGRSIAAEALLEPVDTARRRQLADAALSAARGAGASYCDVRVGRYLRQSVITREARVENVVNAESSGVGVRVLVDGAWGFAATNVQTVDAVAGAARLAAGIARANAKSQTRPVQLAPVRGVGEARWATPVRTNAMAVPLKDKVDLLLAVNAAGMEAGADFFSSNLFVVNEQKYFASTDGSYIDQDVHRIWLPITATAIDKASGKFRTRNGLSAPMGMGYEYLDADPAGRVALPGGVTAYGSSYDVMADAVSAARDARAKLKAPSVKPSKY
ncbi:MAG: hypothetical protein NDI66_09375, partial [Pseudomonas sp.]|nr:hypothetical protein [Pseudomonas sp.]